jgi:hypothetical protein
MATVKRNLLLPLLALTLVRGLIYAAVTPPWQAPDETGHFEYVWLVTNTGQLPIDKDTPSAIEQEMLGSLYEWRYGEYIGRPLPERMPARIDDLPQSVFAQRSRPAQYGRFSLSYLWAALFILPLRHQDLVFQLFTARMSSVILNIAAVLLAYLTLRELLPSRPKLVALMTTVVVFLPQHTFVNSAVGDGPLAETMVCLVLYCWARLFRRGFGAWEVAGVALGTVAGILSKATATFLVPVDMAMALWLILYRSQRAWTRRQVMWLGAGFSALGIGTLLGIVSFVGIDIQSTLELIFTPSSWTWVDQRGITLGNALLRSYDSFWANFGWMAVPVSERWYGAIALLSLSALAGWVIGEPNKDLQPWAVGLMGIPALVACTAFVWVALLAQEAGYYQSQGRYLFPAVIPYSFLLVGGLERVVPSRLRSHVAASLLLFLVCFDALCLAGYSLPFFY